MSEPRDLAKRLREWADEPYRTKIHEPLLREAAACLLTVCEREAQAEDDLERAEARITSLVWEIGLMRSEDIDKYPGLRERYDLEHRAVLASGAEKT